MSYSKKIIKAILKDENVKIESSMDYTQLLLLVEMAARKIREEIIKSGKARPWQLIDYSEFLKLYEPYKDIINEKEFVAILEITSYNDIKNGGKSTILRSMQKEVTEEKQELTEREEKEIIEEILSSGKVKPGQLIDYTEFLELYNPFKDYMNEIKFADVLEIYNYNYWSMKNIKGRKTKILKSIQKKLIEEEKKLVEERRKLIDEEKKKIVQQVLKSGKIKPGDAIDYSQFLELYKPYRNTMVERKFAELLEITKGAFDSMKYKGQRAKVLKSMQKEITEEDKREIIKEVLSSRQVKAGELINYSQFLELYAPYKARMDERKFAGLLEINGKAYKSIKKGRRAKVLKSMQKEVTEEEKKEIVNEIFRNKRVKERQLINYEQFLSLYEPYKDKMKESEFAKLLGINSVNLNGMKHRRSKSKSTRL